MLRILLQCADLLQCPPLHLVPLAWPTTMLKLWLVFTKRPWIKDIRAPIVFTYTFLPAHTYYSYQDLLHTLLLARDICPLKLHLARMKKDHLHYFIIDVKKVPNNNQGVTLPSPTNQLLFQFGCVQEINQS